MGTNDPKSDGPRDSWVVFDNGQGSETGKVHRLTRHVAVFEVFEGGTLLQMSQLFKDFTILFREKEVYSGRAVVRSLINTGLATICEVSLEEDKGLRAENAAGEIEANLPDNFTGFLDEYHQVYRIPAEFKVVVSDLYTFLADLRFWLDHLEEGIRMQPEAEQEEQLQRTVRSLEDPVLEVFNNLHERFEPIINQADRDLRPALQHHTCRHLQPLFLASPFGYRAYSKPLGYAGDYAMVNMIMGDPYQGTSLFARIMNLLLLRQYPSEAHRNRIKYLKDRLVEESLRVDREGRRARVLNLACGPAHEIQSFLETCSFSSQVEFLLVDMNEETLRHVKDTLEGIKQRLGRRTQFQFRKRSALGLLKDASRSATGKVTQEFDFVYCAGLFDYLSDPLCRQLTEMFARWLTPGGLVVTTNVDAAKPFRYMLEFLLDWYLNYRTAKQFAQIGSGLDDSFSQLVQTDSTGVNLFLEIRKPRR